MLFQGRQLLIATMHAKEKVLAPLLEEELKVSCELVTGFDTDQFGTFTGEVARMADPVQTARMKCSAAIEKYGYDLVLSSEGSFGPHPSLIFIPADEEILFLFDARNQLEIVVRNISTSTNFNSSDIRTENELMDFARQVKFPEHGIILKSGCSNSKKIIKGIQDEQLLIETFGSMIRTSAFVTAETDMRAFCNPTRMEVIRETALLLLKKIASVCPQCGMPGYDVVKVRDGLPCNLCRFPTRSTLSYEYGCNSCNFRELVNYPHGKMQEDPMYCDRCNP